jgi:hypothetical protein
MVLDDEYLHPFAQLFSGLADVEAQFADPETRTAMRITGVAVDLPIELTIGVTDAGTVALASAPPTQQVSTTYMPVFHRVRIAIAADQDEDDGDG